MLLDLMMERTLRSSRHAHDVIARRLRVRRPEDFRAARFELGREFLQIAVEVIDGLPFDCGRGIPRAGPALVAVFDFVAFDVVTAPARV